MTKKVIDRGKRNKTLSNVKSVKNISKNLQSFLEISPVQKEVLPTHKVQIQVQKPILATDQMPDHT